ncbi:MAG: hypothetical protein J6A53_02665 [Clostridia bacterium]|nr:hypothetical protein [Clostridia bacterium]
MKILGVTYLSVITNKGTVLKKLQDTVLWLENGKKFPYREQYVLSDFTGEKRLEIMPKSSRNIVYLLNYLKSEPACIPEDQKPNRKTLILTVNLNKKQQEELNKLKSLCK